MSTIDQAQIRESPPAKDWRPNQWATSPNCYTRTSNQIASFFTMLVGTSSISYVLSRLDATR